MCIGGGQVQAGLLRRGWESAVVGGGGDFSEDLTDGRVLPSRLWQPERSWSRRDAAKACVAACVSMALQRWIRALVREWLWLTETGVTWCHKWLGCILSGNNRGNHRLDLTYDLLAASKAFFANRNIVCNETVSLVKRLQFFDKIVTPVACFAAGHRKGSQNRSGNDGRSFSPVASISRRPPSQTNWRNPWHEILHDLECSGSKICSRGWRCDVVAAKLTTVLAFVFVRCWFT